MSTAHASEKHAEQERERATGSSNDELTVGRDAVARHSVLCAQQHASQASVCVRECVRAFVWFERRVVALHSSTALSKPICSFCAMPYLCAEEVWVVSKGGASSGGKWRFEARRLAA